MILESLDLLGDERDRAPLLESLEALCELGWDREHGGLLRYCDREGPVAPQGTASGTPYEQLVSSTWSTKLWWVHSEAAARRRSRRGVTALSRAEDRRIWEYTLATFPGGEDGEEWIQIRDREGAPWIRSWLCR